jgi:hypothetical protein
MRIRRGQYFADVLKDARSPSEVWHWIVQREHSNEIVAMGQETSEDEARQCAEQNIAKLDRKQTAS